MSGFAQITVMGHVGKDPEIRSTQNGTKVANFSLAYSERWNDAQGEKHERTTWFRVDAWNGPNGKGLVSSVVDPYIRKGSHVMVQGQPVIEEFTDKDGVKRNVFKIKLGGPNSALRLLGGGGQVAKRETDVGEKAGTAAGSAQVEDDDIPF